MIATNIVIFISASALLAFAISTLLLYLKYPQSRAVKMMALYFVCISLSLLLTSLRNQIPNFLSLQIGLSIVSVGYMFLYMGIKDLLGMDGRWYNYYYIPLIVLFLGIFIFTYLYYDTHMRVIVFSLYITLFTFATGVLFWQASQEKFTKLNQIVAIFYLLIAFVFLMRALNALTTSFEIGSLYSNKFIVNAPYALLVTMTVVLIIVSNLYLRSKERS